MTSEPAQAASTGRRPRRSGEEVRRLILAAARDEFAAHGFKGSTTRAVAESAGVSLQLLYSHFDSKQGLFEAAVVGPFEDFIESYTATWSTEYDDSGDMATMLRTYIEDVYHLARRHRHLLRAVPVEALGRTHARGALDQIEAFCQRLVREGGLHFDAPIAVRAVLVLVLTMAVYEDQLLPGRDRADIIAELAETLLFGLAR